MTSRSFDPYHKWLGIPPHEQPPTHYRLLRISEFESDQDVVEHAYNKEMNSLKQQEHGEYADLVEQLGRELFEARKCLLNDAAKAEYDAQLRARAASRESDAMVRAGDKLDQLQPHSSSTAVPSSIDARPVIDATLERKNDSNIEVSSHPAVLAGIASSDPRHRKYPQPSSRKISMLAGLSIAALFVIAAVLVFWIARATAPRQIVEGETKPNDVKNDFPVGLKPRDTPDTSETHSVTDDSKIADLATETAPTATNSIASRTLPAEPTVAAESSDTANIDWRTVAAARADVIRFRGIHSIQVKWPYVYALDWTFGKSDLWVFELSKEPLDVNTNGPFIKRFVRRHGREYDLNGTTATPQSVSTETESFYVPDAGAGLDLLVLNDVLLCPRQGALELYSLKDPLRPTHVRQVGTPRGGDAMRLCKAGSTLALVTRGQLTSFDVSDPWAPKQIGSAYRRADIWGGACIVGDYLYTATLNSKDKSESGIVVFDYSDPERPREAGFLRTGTTSYHLFEIPGRKLLAIGDSPSRIFDLSDPENPTEISEQGNSLRVSSRAACIFRGNGEFLVAARGLYRFNQSGLLPGPTWKRSLYLPSGIPYRGTSDASLAIIPSANGIFVLRPDDLLEQR